MSLNTSWPGNISPFGKTQSQENAGNENLLDDIIMITFLGPRAKKLHALVHSALMVSEWTYHTCTREEKEDPPLSRTGSVPSLP